MTTAGLGFPPLINLGIGNELGLAFDKERHKNVSNGVFICNENIQNLRTLIAAIESDVVLNENFKKSMKELIIHEKLSFGSDAIIQLIASAAKSSIPESQKFAVEIIDISKDAPLEILDPITYQLRFKFPNMAKIPRDLSASASYYYLEEIKLKTKEGPSEFKRGNLKREYIPLLKTIFSDLDRPSLNWIQLHYPHAAKLYQDIYD
jgi:hypothetical protein